MSASEAYFTGFHRDIAAKRFAVIINEPLFLEIQTGGEAFMEENNAYVRWVSRPLACYYYPVYTSDENRLQILIPRRQTPANFANCPAAD